MQPDTSPSPAAKTENPRSTLISRNVTICSHRTSVRLEPEMWNGLTEIRRRERATLHEICTAVAQSKNENASLTAAIRVFIMAYYRTAATEEGHTRAGHGQGVTVGAAVSSIMQKVFAQAAPLALKPLPETQPTMMGYRPEQPLQRF